MTALAAIKNHRVENAQRLMAPAITAMATGGDQPLRSVKLPTWQEIVDIGQSVQASLGKRTSAPEAADLIEVFIGTRVNAKMADPDSYLRAVRSLLTQSPPDVAAEAVYNLITANKYMPEVAELDTALQDATVKRHRIVQACRVAYKECQRRAAESESARQRAEERAANVDDPCWQEWMRQVGQSLPTVKPWEQFKREWGG